VQCSDKTFLALACLLNVLMRLPLLLINVTPTSDFGWYFGRAQELAQGAGYAQGGVPTAFWPVGWPGFLGGLLYLFGPHVVVGQCANLVMSTLNICLLAAIGTRLFADSPVWRVAALVMAVLPNQIAYVPLLSTEIFFEFLLLLGFLLVMSRSVMGLITAGLVFGVAALTKSQATLLPLVVAIPLLSWRDRWHGLRV
jgi:Gpi18-like mannosyltransferase